MLAKFAPVRVRPPKPIEQIHYARLFHATKSTEALNGDNKPPSKMYQSEYEMYCEMRLAQERTWMLIQEKLLLEMRELVIKYEMPIIAAIGKDLTVNERATIDAVKAHPVPNRTAEDKMKIKDLVLRITYFTKKIQELTILELKAKNRELNNSDVDSVKASRARLWDYPKLLMEEQDTRRAELELLCWTSPLEELLERGPSPVEMLSSQDTPESLPPELKSYPTRSYEHDPRKTYVPDPF
jgi:hypothetical protein